MSENKTIFRFLLSLKALYPLPIKACDTDLLSPAMSQFVSA
ncbi:hypothetical protein JCM19232_5531 [Vibrio ishigakensis]|uniref:Uncharacterized protein n=1 Tax=Vibrio ishigakensis TaxID=1481914 RepID=A0A0B8P374_9VIBR|nr:hypothetical protein JCM19232_5531 [Vibrio ishigakensis]